MEERPILSLEDTDNIVGEILEDNTVIKPEKKKKHHNKKERDMIKSSEMKNGLPMNTKQVCGTVYSRK